MVDRPVSKDFEILRMMPGRGVRAGLVEGVRHAHAFDRLLRDAVDHDRCRNAADFEKGRRNIDEMVELRAHATHVRDMTGPGDGQALPGAAEVRRYLLDPLERRVEGPGPPYRHVRLSLDRTPVIVMLQLLSDGDLDGLKTSHVKGSSERRAFRARPVVAADIDDQCVVEFAHVCDFLYHPADLMVGICRVGGKDIRLTDEKLLFVGTECVPLRELDASVFGLPVGPGRQLGVRWDHAELFLVGKDLLTQLVPALVEQVHVADLLDPFRRWLMRRV